MGDLFSALMGFIVIPAIWGLLAVLLEDWLNNMVDKGLLPDGFYTSRPVCIIIAAFLLVLIATVLIWLDII